MTLNHTPNIVNLYTVGNVLNWVDDPNHLYIGRKKGELSASKWQNSYNITTSQNRTKAIQKFETKLHQSQHLVKSVNELKGKILGCWCAPLQCHGEVLHRLAGNPICYQFVETSANNSNMMETEPEQSRIDVRDKVMGVKEIVVRNLGVNVSVEEISQLFHLDSEAAKGSTVTLNTTETDGKTEYLAVIRVPEPYQEEILKKSGVELSELSKK